MASWVEYLYTTNFLLASIDMQLTFTNGLFVFKINIFISVFYMSEIIRSTSTQHTSISKVCPKIKSGTPPLTMYQQYVPTRRVYHLHLICTKGLFSNVEWSNSIQHIPKVCPKMQSGASPLIMHQRSVPKCRVGHLHLASTNSLSHNLEWSTSIYHISKVCPKMQSGSSLFSMHQKSVLTCRVEYLHVDMYQKVCPKLQSVSPPLVMYQNVIK